MGPSTSVQCSKPVQKRNSGRIHFRVELQSGQKNFLHPEGGAVQYTLGLIGGREAFPLRRISGWCFRVPLSLVSQASSFPPPLRCVRVGPVQDFSGGGPVAGQRFCRSLSAVLVLLGLSFLLLSSDGEEGERSPSVSTGPSRPPSLRPDTVSVRIVGSSLPGDSVSFYLSPQQIRFSSSFILTTTLCVMSG